MTKPNIEYLTSKFLYGLGLKQCDANMSIFRMKCKEKIKVYQLLAVVNNSEECVLISRAKELQVWLIWHRPIFIDSDSECIGNQKGPFGADFADDIRFQQATTWPSCPRFLFSTLSNACNVPIHYNVIALETIPKRHAQVFRKSIANV